MDTTNHISSLLEPELSKPALHILVVDDEYPTRIALASALRKCGYKPYSSSDGAEALEMMGQISRIGKKIDLAIVDIQKPGLAAEQFMSEWKKMGTPFPVLITSGYADKAFIIYLLSKGIIDFLEKRWEAHKRILRVAELMGEYQKQANEKGS